MSNTETLSERNRAFMQSGHKADLPILPKLRTVILTCGDARVDPAHTLGLELGDSVVIRNNGGRVTPEVAEEIAALAFLVARMDGDEPKPFEFAIIQHTQCGAQRFADPELQALLMSKAGLDVSKVAIRDHGESLQQDVERLCETSNIPGHVVVSTFLYDVTDGKLGEVLSPTPLSELRSAREMP